MSFNGFIKTQQRLFIAFRRWDDLRVCDVPSVLSQPEEAPEEPAEVSETALLQRHDGSLSRAPITRDGNKKRDERVHRGAR